MSDNSEILITWGE